MVSKTNKTKLKRLPKGQRTHVRRLKQAASEDGTIYRSPLVRRAPAKITGE
jgi:hypothetical protein